MWKAVSAMSVDQRREIRASDADRSRVVQLLSEHTGAGRLTLAEFEERTSAAYQARMVSDLDPLLADLPVPSARPMSAARPVRRDRRPHWMWWPRSAWAFTAVLCLAIWGLTSLAAGKPIYFWPFWVIVPWGFGMVPWGRRYGCRRANR
jgi:Domain of unknown function (DUF1707)